MKKIIFLLLSIGLLLPGYSSAALQDIHIDWSYDYQVVEGKTLTGYYLYQEGTKVCTNDTPTDRAMDCSFYSGEGTFDFTLTAYYDDGSESPHSPHYSVTFTTPVPPVAAISPAIFSGTAPLKVSFDGSSSTGAVSYEWIFGDGNTASDSQIEHIFATAGTFTTTLTVTNAEGLTNETTAIITARENTPPKAVISTSATVGEAPLRISFDGLGSYDSDDPEGQISS